MMPVRCLGISAAVLLLSACSSSNVVEDHYYSLVLAANDNTSITNDADAATRLIVLPVMLPAYLGGRGLVMQVGENRIESASHHFWAEPLDEAIAKVLVQDIAGRTSGIAVERQRGRYSPQGDCLLRVEFDAFHPTADSRVVSRGRYWISSEENSTQFTFALHGSLTIDGYAHSVDELRETLRTLAQQIADEAQRTAPCVHTGGT